MCVCLLAVRKLKCRVAPPFFSWLFCRGLGFFAISSRVGRREERRREEGRGEGGGVERATGRWKDECSRWLCSCLVFRTNRSRNSQMQSGGVLRGPRGIDACMRKKEKQAKKRV